MCIQKKIKGNVRNVHWVGHTQLRSLEPDYFFIVKPAVDEKQASVTRNIIKQSVSGGGNNPFI